MYLISEGKIGWSPISNLGSYVGVLLFAPISSKLVDPPAPDIGRKVGFTMLGIDSRRISDFLKSIKVPKGALLMVVVPRNDLITPTLGMIVGTTHGNPYKMTSVTRDEYNYTDPFPLDCTESPDSLTKATCKYILKRPGGFLGFDREETYKVPLLGEQHFLKVYIVSDVSTDLMWAIVLVVPYRTIMGPIDDAMARTKEKIRKNSDDTEKAKEHSYMIMYVTLASVALWL